jgi:hypothetical protein
VAVRRSRRLLGGAGRGGRGHAPRLARAPSLTPPARAPSLTPAKAYVLTYAGADWVGADPTAADGFAADPAAAVGAALPGDFLFIAGEDDLLFSRASVTRYARAAAGDVRLEWRPGGHGDYWAVPDAEDAGMHRAWLERRL